MELVTQLRAGPPVRSIGQRHIGLINRDKEAALPKEGARELLHGRAALREAAQLHAVEAGRVVEHTRAINHRNGLVLGDQDLVGAQVSIRASGLELCDGGLVLAQLAQQLQDVGVHAGRGHAVGIVRHTPKPHALARGERLPVRVATHMRQLSTQVHEARGVLVRPEEKQLLAALHVAGEDAALRWHHAVQERVQVPDEARSLRRGALGGAAGNEVSARGPR
mmetsp:Transcript_53243/g.142640  ORF Transcript_53243/g.142640 Transcript_53243/m.142640 type:complete len:222 (-) Transcript_53243:212-877(-)